MTTRHVSANRHAASHHAASPSALPDRRERLRMFIKLKTQRQMLLIALAVSLALMGLLIATTLRDRTGEDAVPLGRGMATVAMPPAEMLEERIGSGEASFYGDELAGNLTASGETFDPARLTAAHRTLPLGSRVRVTNPGNGESVVVRINDRGPYHGNRVIDLSYAAAREIGLIRSGTGRVHMALLD